MIVKNYQQCTRCILDTNDDPFIAFDANGLCNHCRNYDKLEKEQVFKGHEGEIKLAETVEAIKKAGAGKEYDCILGVSGGVDSTYLAYKAKELGLRTLCVHFDNGWNSELAVKNIENIVSKLGLDLYTYVVDWLEFKDIQLAYFKANVIDIEVVTDHAIGVILNEIAAKNKIKYILSGNNVVTEAILPKYWIFNKSDYVNLIDIHNKYGQVKIKTYPLLNYWKQIYYAKIKKIKTVKILNYLPYNYTIVKQIIIDKLNWVDYGGKHYESVFTRFYQGYILPQKFGIDKRKAHLSNLICSGQISKEKAIEEIKKPIYPEELLIIDKEYVFKKLDFTTDEFKDYLNQPRREHAEFKTIRSFYENYPIFKPIKPFINLIRNI
jgi:N-acetyl sugar amidotransferase